MRKLIPILLFSLIGLHARSETFSVDTTIFSCQVHDAVITAGEDSISCMLDGELISMDMPEGMLLQGIAAFGDGVIAITKGKHILFWDSPFDKARRIRIDMKGEFTGIEAGSDICYAISDSSEIISVNRALTGKVLDFNSEYAEYYGKLRLIDIAAGPSSVFISAVKEDGRPAVFTSSKGTVWSEREMNYAINGIWYMFEKVPHSITYEELSESFVLLCEDGTEFHLPACSHCNYLIEK